MGCDDAVSQNLRCRNTMFNNRFSGFRPPFLKEKPVRNNHPSRSQTRQEDPNQNSTLTRIRPCALPKSKPPSARSGTRDTSLAPSEAKTQAMTDATSLQRRLPLERENILQPTLNGVVETKLQVSLPTSLRNYREATCVFNSILNTTE